jgi:hypothetical protein
MDQNQQNIIKTNKSQQKIEAIFGGDFRIWGRTQQNKARKRGVGAPNS